MFVIQMQSATILLVLLNAVVYLGTLETDLTVQVNKEIDIPENTLEKL